MRHDSSGRPGIFRVPGGPFSVSFHVEKHKSGKYHLQKTTFLKIMFSLIVRHFCGGFLRIIIKKSKNLSFDY